MGPISGRSNLAGELWTRMVYAKSKKLRLKNWEQTIQEKFGNTLRQLPKNGAANVFIEHAPANCTWKQNKCYQCWNFTTISGGYRNRVVGLCNLAARSGNPIPTRFLGPVDCSKIPGQDCSSETSFNLPSISHQLIQTQSQTIIVLGSFSILLSTSRNEGGVTWKSIFLLDIEKEGKNLHHGLPHSFKKLEVLLEKTLFFKKIIFVTLYHRSLFRTTNRIVSRERSSIFYQQLFSGRPKPFIHSCQINRIQISWHFPLKKPKRSRFSHCRQKPASLTPAQEEEDGDGEPHTDCQAVTRPIVEISTPSPFPSPPPHHSF